MTMERKVSLDVREHVAERYGQIARTGGSCCGGGGTGVARHGEAIGYSADQLASVPEGANLGLGCGNPLTLAMVEKGMTVVDLGSGAGIDCFLASPLAGPTGRVIGVDMTDAMLERARSYAASKGYTNVEFRKGHIEELPVADGTVDLVISNCVINLSPDKARVFREIARVLKPGGRASVSDIVVLQPLPDVIRQDMEAYIGCLAGADLEDVYLGHAKAAGLTIGQARRKSYDVLSVLGCSPEAGKLLEHLPKGFDGNAYVASIDVVAVKPGA